MRREYAEIGALRDWINRNHVQLNCATISKLENGHGSGIVATQNVDEENFKFVVVPRSLILNRAYVWAQANSDRHLRELLEVNGDFAETPRGAILIFLLLQISASSPDMPASFGVQNPWIEYIKFIPDELTIPTFFTEDERKCLWGTSLEHHLAAKTKSLDREFAAFQNATKSLDWCEPWWNSEHGCLTIKDWKIVDAMYRSRAMDFEEYGLCLVPVMDMANHSGLDAFRAMYNIEESTHDACLSLEENKSVNAGEEITIMYGLYRGAADSVFSYGFIEEDLPTASSMFLGVNLPEDDPLALAKVSALDIKNGFKIYTPPTTETPAWSSPFIWAMCINEEDGLKLQLEIVNDSEKRLRVTWKGQSIENQYDLETHLRTDYFWDLFQLRAYTIVHERIEDEIRLRTQLFNRPAEEKRPRSIDENSPVWSLAENLRKLELDLLRKAAEEFFQKIVLLESQEAVEQWFKERRATDDVDFNGWSKFEQAASSLEVDEPDFVGSWDEINHEELSTAEGTMAASPQEGPKLDRGWGLPERTVGEGSWEHIDVADG